ncbi:CLC_0170 family protein [Crassaminicella profunda]|uniref:CLC_0170 family protein n=1 Tax=Crassaminicella profunda TaxID=1286698 RepID=UPI001CA6B677|nr:CLC_0170 family protein [Crassaminicella profunda]QZY55465.1 hypothetical protein K7H06_21130 [Crassaminicella profunda]
MPKWIAFFYEEMKDFYTFYMLFLSIVIGLFCLLIDCKTLKKKKLRKEMKICAILGWTYIVGGILLYITFKIF